MTKPYILPYNMKSKSAKTLARSLHAWRLKINGNSGFLHRANRTVINWGSNNGEYIGKYIRLDRNNLNCRLDQQGVPNVVLATNKLKFFKELSKELPEYLPDWTESREEATKWVENGSVVFCRALLRGNSGDGITVATEVHEIAPSPLYVKYIKKEEEFRVHVFNGSVIDIQRKMRKEEIPDEKVNWKIRNTRGGFIYGRNNINPPDNMEDVCIRATKLLGLDFGAFDVIYNKHYNKIYLLEVNTAPGLEGTTLEKYREAIINYCDGGIGNHKV